MNQGEEEKTLPTPKTNPTSLPHSRHYIKVISMKKKKKQATCTRLPLYTISLNFLLEAIKNSSRTAHRAELYS